MARPPHAREKVLDAYIALLYDEGERAATMDAAARDAGVSKGGLLYHYGSKDALNEGVLDRFRESISTDLVEMAEAPEGPSTHYVRTSWVTEAERDPTYTAVLRLAQSGSLPAVDALEWAHSEWLRLIQEEVGDPHVAEAIMLIGEGLYHQAAMPGEWARGTFATSIDHLLAQVERLKAATA